MKKTLRESLVDYDMGLLRALAEVRGAVLTSNHQPTAVDELAAQLIAPASVAIACADLSLDETQALAALQAAGGWMEMPRFVRRFGAARPMGPGRLARERPWLAPANPAEGLWYRGFIFRGFRQTETGVVEVTYIPDDLLALLPAVPPIGFSFTLEPVAEPPRVRRASADLIEDVFSLLVYLRNHDVQPGPGDSLRLKDLQAVNALCIAPVPAASAASDDRLAFIAHLCRASGLATVTQDRLVLDSDRVRGWLQATPTRRLAALQTTWRDDPDWNDLWRVPSLRPQPTGGWRNDPLLARRKVLDFLARCQPSVWYRLDDFIAAVKSADPDFQRPDGDYTAWYLHDQRGQSLMGFEHWDEVEGGLLRYLVACPLHWLGVTDLGLEEDFSAVVAFRLSESGLPLLGHSPGEESSTPAPMAVHDDCTVRVPLNASLYDRFQLARFADPAQRRADHISYRISPASLARARRQGITVEQISTFLARVSAQQVPSRALEALQRWSKRSGAIRLERSVILRVDHPETLTALRRHPAIASLLGEALGPQAVLVPPANIQRVRRWLVDQGYLDER